MPELPEVESIRRALVAPLLRSTLRLVSLNRRDIVVSDSARPSDASLLGGARVVSIRRHGKQLAIVGDTGAVLVVGLGMTGQLGISAPNDPLPSHVHVLWEVRRPRTKRLSLWFRDPRRFGRLVPLHGNAALAGHWGLLGPDALTLTPAQLKERVGSRRSSCKAFLLDQHRIAGLGNIYVDESLFRAKIHPLRVISSLNDKERLRLVSAVRFILRASVASGGSTIRDYRLPRGERGTFVRRHKVYGKAGQPCWACGTLIHTAIVAGRTTAWCAQCQPR